MGRLLPSVVFALCPPTPATSATTLLALVLWLASARVARGGWAYHNAAVGLSLTWLNAGILQAAGGVCEAGCARSNPGELALVSWLVPCRTYEAWYTPALRRGVYATAGRNSLMRSTSDELAANSPGARDAPRGVDGGDIGGAFLQRY
jgi:hypothetical protein